MSERRRAWQRINDLFARHGLQPPPTRLRDELVMHLLAYDREECAARAELSGDLTASDAPIQSFPASKTLPRYEGESWLGLRRVDWCALAVIAFSAICAAGAVLEARG